MHRIIKSHISIPINYYVSMNVYILYSLFVLSIIQFEVKLSLKILTIKYDVKNDHVK